MQKLILVLLCVLLVGVIAGALLLPQLTSDGGTPLMRWDQDQEIEGVAELLPEDGESPSEDGAFDRSEAGVVAAITDVGNPDERVMTLLRGRVVDEFQAPVAGAKVWLEFGRSQRRNQPSRRIPEPVTTDTEGRFAFEGQAFRRLRVTLVVQEERHALGLFEKDDLVEAEAAAANGGAAEHDLGDLVLKSGGEVTGRVTDLDGNGVAAAEVSLQPEMQNRLRWMRDREKFLPPRRTDNNGYYRFTNVLAGVFAVHAVAPHHTEQRSQPIDVKDGGVVEVPDIRLGPGYELMGIVRAVSGAPIAGANVVVRNSRNQPDATEPDRPGRGPQGGRGAFAGRGREHSTKTDDKGRFFLEHLPGALLELRTDAKGFLDYAQDGIDAKLARPIDVTMQEGLKITGEVRDSAGAPVETFAFDTVRLRGLPDPALAGLSMETLQAQMRDGSLDQATRDQMRRQIEGLRNQMSGGDRGGRNRPWDQGNERGSALDRAEKHPGGRFVADGLQEGVYELVVQAPDHARYRSAEIEVRLGVVPPHVVVTLDAGVFVAGRVIDDNGLPIANASVELRSTTERTDDAPRRGRRDRGGEGQPGGGPPNVARAAAEMARFASGTNLRLEARSDRDGQFVFKHVPRGRFDLQAEKDGFRMAHLDAFDLTADRSGIELQLGLLGSITGTVGGFAEREAGEVRVGAVLLPDQEGGTNVMANMFRGGRGRNGFRTVDVAADGSYHIDELEPGDYVVRSWVGSPQQLMRELGPSFFDGSLTADVRVRSGEETRFDMQLTRPQLGTVAGTVLRNGVGAAGFQVELRRQDENGTAPRDQGGGGGRGGRGMMNFGRSQQATVADDGTFQIKDVPAGTYELSVRSSRRAGSLLTDVVQVLANVTVERSYAVETASLRATLSAADGTDPKSLNGRASLLPGLAAIPEDLDAWQRQNTSYEARITNGGFTIDTAPPGNYLLIVRARDRERVQQQITLHGETTIGVVVGAPTAAGSGTNGAPR